MPDWFRNEFDDNDIQRQLTMNPVTLRTLEDSGSNLSKPHRIEHHFYCSSKQICDELSIAGRDLGYETANRSAWHTDDGHTYQYMDLVKPTIPTKLNLDNDVNILVSLAIKHQAIYDGWGTSTVD